MSGPSGRTEEEDRGEGLMSGCQVTWLREDKGADGQEVVQVDTRHLHHYRSRAGGFESLQDAKLRTMWCVMVSSRLASPKK
jgi:hypothetical protein